MAKVIKFKPPYAKAVKRKDSKNTTRLYKGKRAAKRKISVKAVKPTKANFLDFSKLSKLKTLRDPNFRKFLVEAEKRINAQEKLNIKDPKNQKTLTLQKKIIDAYRRRDLAEIKKIEETAVKQTFERISKVDFYINETSRLFPHIINETEVLSKKDKTKLRQNKRFAGAIDKLIENTESIKKKLDAEAGNLVCHSVAYQLNSNLGHLDFTRYKSFDIQLKAYIDGKLLLLDLLDLPD